MLGLVAGCSGTVQTTTADPTDTSPPTATNIETQEQVQQRQALMDALIPQVRHFKGSPDAPVTIIEFSDFL
jgi:uncharacterized lipoprotein YddW (UPF0748 family)